jgi:hypothetical protein
MKTHIILVLKGLLLISCQMNNITRVKKEIKYESLKIRLYDVKTDNMQNQSVANIQAFDLHDKLLWTIEAPTFNHFYFDMQINELEGLLEADSGEGQVYKIDLKTGNIIESKLIK